MQYKVKPPGTVIETSISDDPDDLSVVDLQIVVTPLQGEDLESLAFIRFTVDAELTTNPASITPQAGSFGVWELVGPVDPAGSSFVATPVNRPPQGGPWTFHLRDVEVATGLADTTITVTEIRTNGTETETVVDAEGDMTIRKIDPVLRIDYFRMVDGPTTKDALEPSLESGESATLAWATVAPAQNQVWLYGPNADTDTSGLVDEDGTCTITPTTTSTYTLVARNGKAHAVAQLTVTVPDKAVVPKLESTGDVEALGTVKAKEIEDQHGPVVPKGLIAMWSGAIKDVPAGWALCDGKEGPDLRSRFVVGARADAQARGDAVHDTGGADAVTLTWDQMPSHGHSLSEAGKHSHTYDVLQFTEKKDNTYGVADAALWRLIKGVLGTFTTAEVMSHSHTVGRSGRDGSHENRPPFYALAFIIKL